MSLVVKVEWDRCKAISRLLVDTGKSNPQDVEPLLEKQSIFDSDEIKSRYLYLSCVLDQGPDIIGVRRMLREVIDSLYPHCQILHQPDQFFSNIIPITELIREIAQEVKKERGPETGIKAYSLLDQSRICPTVTLRWGTPFLVLKRLQEDNRTLLKWVDVWDCADEVVSRIRNDETYGLGTAIGHKASRLFIKFLLHTYKIIRKAGPYWDANSYRIPIDSNVGRVLMRSGFLFYFIEFDEFDRQCCTRQPGGRINLGANKMRDIKIPLTHPDHENALTWLRRIYPKKRGVNLPWALNYMLQQIGRDGEGEGIGAMDDGLMHVGINFCNNNPKEVKCSKCPLGNICYAYNEERELIETYYCGTGAGVFY